jgi:hypothetical protein
MHKSATKCNKTLGKWCKNKYGASKIIDTFETYHAPKLVIPGAFWFGGDLHADDNAYRWRMLRCAGDKKITAGAFVLCAGTTFIPGKLVIGAPGIKFQKIQKNPNILKL